MARPKKFDEAETLLKAQRVFWQKGYAGTSMQDLVAAMGINAPSLYATYGDKHTLFIRALTNYKNSQHDWMKSLAQDQHPVRKTIRQLLEALVEDGLTDPDRKGCFVVNTTTELANQDPEAAAIVVENGKDVRNLLCNLIEHGQATGELSASKQPEVLATYLFTVIQGLRVMTATHQSRALLQSTVTLVLDNL